MPRKGPGRVAVLLVIGLFLWPAVTLTTDLLGRLYLDEFVPGGDFGLVALDYTGPVCYAVGLFFVIRYISTTRTEPQERVFGSIVMVLIYSVCFAGWTFLAYPFGRVSKNW